MRDCWVRALWRTVTSGWLNDLGGTYQMAASRCIIYCEKLAEKEEEGRCQVPTFKMRPMPN